MIFFADSAFTERVLGLPTENYKGYVEADATQRAKHIPTRSIFIIHGLADLTAPYQHGVALARALTEAGILYRYQVHTHTLHYQHYVHLARFAYRNHPYAFKILKLKILLKPQN